MHDDSHTSLPESDDDPEDDQTLPETADSGDTAPAGVSSEEHRTGPRITVNTVTEIQRRLLDVNSAIGDLETHLTVVTELLAADADVDRAELQREVTAVVDQIEDASERIGKIERAAHRLNELVADRPAATEADRDWVETEGEWTSVFTDSGGSVRNR